MVGRLSSKHMQALKSAGTLNQSETLKSLVSLNNMQSIYRDNAHSVKVSFPSVSIFYNNCPCDETQFSDFINVHIFHSHGVANNVIKSCFFVKASQITDFIIKYIYVCYLMYLVKLVGLVTDERDAVQKKTFTKWMNKHLIKVSSSQVSSEGVLCE